MKTKKTDLVIVNRSFWPQNQVIGEGLLQFAERVAERQSVCVITQTEDDLQSLMSVQGRGRGIDIRACKSYTTSASGFVERIAEAVFFMFWTFYCLVKTRPATVYVSTNPPVVVPFTVAVYCQLFGAEYVYHLQDIHPEAANIVVPLNRFIFRLLKSVDNYTLRHAKAIITLSEDMEKYVLKRSDTRSPIHLVDNPSFEIIPVPMAQRKKDVVFCGNAGRLQRIPLLMTAIREYLQQGGKLRFTFAGGGLYAPDLRVLADAYDQVDYLGLISAAEASELVTQHCWALLPIDDEVTRYAFPSKSSGYALSGAGVLAICGMQTSVAKWVVEQSVGIVCVPEHEALVSLLFELENKNSQQFEISDSLKNSLQLPFFAKKLCSIVFGTAYKANDALKSTTGVGL